MARAKPSTGIDFRMRLLGWQEVAKGAETSGAAVRQLGTSAEVAGRKAAESQRGWGIFTRNTQHATRRAHEARLSVGGLTRTLGGLGIGFAAFTGAREAIDTTEHLGEAALRLNKIQGLTLRQGADLAAVADARGLGMGRLSFATGQFAHQTHLALQGNVKALAVFNALGISQTQLATGSKNMLPLLLKVGDAFNHMAGGPEKTDLGRTLFGRAALQGILPLFREGPIGLASGLKQADAALGSFFKGGIKNVDDFLAAQQQAKFTTMGLQLAIGQFLMPIVARLDTTWSHLVKAIHDGAGPWGVIKGAIGAVIWPIRQVVGFFEHSKTAADILGVALVGLGAAWGVEKIVGATRAIKNFWLVTKVTSGIGALLSWLGRLRAAYVGVAAAEAAASAGQLSLFGGAGAAGGGGLAGRALGIARFLGPAAAFAYGTGLFNPDTAGDTPGTEGAHLRQAQASEFAYFMAHPGRLTRPQISTLPSGVRGALRKALAGRHIPGLWSGGTIASPGMALVGERGPELLRLNQGARVDPLPSALGQDALVAAIRDILAGLRGNVVLDGRELAQSTVQWQLVAAARH